MKTVIPTGSPLRLHSLHRTSHRILLSLLPLSAGVGCSIQNFDYLTNGGASAISPGTGGAAASGGTGAIVSGGQTSNAGGSEAGGLASTASSQGGDAAQGGATGATSTVATGGITQTGGAPTGGASAGPCPMYTGTGGSVVTPPSNDFETNATGWKTVAESTAAISLVAASDACTGSSYLQCAGSARTQNWDGPSTTLLPYIIQGHKYVLTLAARFDPKNAPTAPSSLKLTQVLVCSDSSVSVLYSQIQSNVVSTSWARFSGAVATAMSGCPSLAATGIYLETDAVAASNTIDVDDFQLIDVTVPTTGAGGATGLGGATASGGVAATGGGSAAGGTLGAGGAPVATGGALAGAGGAATGGAPITAGGAPGTGGALQTGGAADAGPDAI